MGIFVVSKYRDRISNKYRRCYVWKANAWDIENSFDTCSIGQALIFRLLNSLWFFSLYEMTGNNFIHDYPFLCDVCISMVGQDSFVSKNLFSL